jgi:hypothetical protein
MLRSALIVAVLCLPALAQTRVWPWQIRDWEQVRPVSGAVAGTRMAVEQIRIVPAVVASWGLYAHVPGPECYSVTLLNEAGVVAGHVIRCRVYPYWDGVIPVGAKVAEYVIPN